jgi:predicted tellurium resistance membrane protein TerC
MLATPTRCTLLSLSFCCLVLPPGVLHLRLRLQVLTFGIITAAVLRAVMILLGTELIQKFEPLLIGFAFILLYSAYGLLFNEEDDDDDLSDNAIVKFCRKVWS